MGMEVQVMSNILVTGATGFVGSALIKRLMQENNKLTATVMAGEDAGHLPAAVKLVTVEPLSDSSNFTNALQNIDIVIHLAARVHIMRESATDPLHEFRKANLHGTVCLARQAAKAGVKRFVFMSTIGVNGDNSGEVPYRESDRPNPHNPYSVTKFEAERALEEISKQTGMEVVILRAPLVYGPGNPGNFLFLLRVISKGIPLPLGAVTNKRSLIYVENLVNALATCAKHSAAAGSTYFVSDGEDVSTPELIRFTAKALGVSVRIFSVPASLINFAGSLTGKSATVNRLLGSLTVDSSKIRRELGWKPPFSMEEGLSETAEWFKKGF
jgi:nucleoside-diphosphate-sugar epimerase